MMLTELLSRGNDMCQQTMTDEQTTRLHMKLRTMYFAFTYSSIVYQMIREWL